MEYNSSLFEYNMFLAEQLMEQAKMQRYINECILISESKNNASNMNILNEGVIDKFKEAIKKIIEALGKMWAKFIESMSTLINSNKSYLEKYKDIILKKKVKDGVKYTMHDYPVGITRLISVSVPAFNYEQMKDHLVDSKTFIENPSYKLKECIVSGSETPFADQCKSYFRGSPEVKTIEGSKLNMTDVFNYCYSYESKMKPVLEKDVREIKAAANDAIDMLEKIQRETPTQESSIFEDKKYYSHVYEQYIIEDGVKISYDGKDNNSQNSDETNAAKNMKNVSGDSATSDQNNKAIKNDKSNNEEEKTKRIQTYLNVCGGLLGAKETIAEEIYKSYMSIIKAHVRDHVGSEKDTKTDKPQDNGTNYKNIVDKAFATK